ncbi:BMP family ABC transporter substrate-binding protein [Iamia majanohamensis]|uniref:BMP family ABC transporter substrate-binding protein n=1 Tax=Iamia majanohamensis TaxID=467976 RepID=A0AAE9Y3L7_9ACTN|nr:BMP family ABC transporter substrate-binding protein [Iamia majanohamensis]WCO65885.1 BMP family ABC transporter substrate-binding protein [Iamia majanohamensis]
MTERLRGGREARPVRVALLVVLLAAACGGSGGAPPVPDPAAVSVAWVNQGKVGTEVWTTAHERGRDAVEEALGDEVETTFVEDVSLGREATQVFDDLAEDGYDLVFATSYAFRDDIVAAAERHPEVRFAHARGRELLPNLATYGGADEEPLYLAGMAAGADSSSGVIGFVGTVPEPETIRHVDAFALGAQAVAPAVEVRVRWVGAWYAPEQEAAAAEALLAEGADVLATGSISPATGAVAEEAGVGWVAHDADRSREVPDVWLTAAVPDWGPYYVDQAEAVRDGSWAPVAYYGDMADGYTDLAPLGRRVPAMVEDRIEAVEEEIRSGDRDVFAGPIHDVAGRRRVPPGAALGPDERASIDWYVRGVTVDRPDG